jgi:hypothetical protein
MDLLNLRTSQGVHHFPGASEVPGFSKSVVVRSSSFLRDCLVNSYPPSSPDAASRITAHAQPIRESEAGRSRSPRSRRLAVRTIAPHTEAHPAAILLQLLAVFGNLVGRGPPCTVDATRHGLNLFVVLVGDSSKARKGTSWSQIARLFAEVDHPWQRSPYSQWPRLCSARSAAAYRAPAPCTL